MSPIVLLGAQFVVVAVAVVAAWVVGHRRLPAPWSAIGWGALAFPLSQVARTALIVPLTLGLTAWLGAGSRSLVVTSLVIAVLTSGLFEETTRWIVMRFWAKRLCTWPDGVAFGLGHGGIEALMIMGAGAVSNIVLLGSADLVRGTVAAQAPEQSAALEAQLSAVQNLTLGMASLGVWERVLAVAFHVVCSLIVLQGVRTWRPGLLALAIVLHCGFNAAAVAMAQVASPVAVELALTACLLPLLWAVARGPLGRSRFQAPAFGEPVRV